MRCRVWCPGRGVPLASPPWDRRCPPAPPRLGNRPAPGASRAPPRGAARGAGATFPRCSAPRRRARCAPPSSSAPSSRGSARSATAPCSCSRGRRLRPSTRCRGSVRTPTSTCSSEVRDAGAASALPGFRRSAHPWTGRASITYSVSSIPSWAPRSRFTADRNGSPGRRRRRSTTSSPPRCRRRPSRACRTLTGSPRGPPRGARLGGAAADSATWSTWPRCGVRAGGRRTSWRPGTASDASGGRRPT